jgi:hypothetical protein
MCKTWGRIRIRISIKAMPIQHTARANNSAHVPNHLLQRFLEEPVQEWGGGDEGGAYKAVYHTIKQSLPAWIPG